MIALYLEGLPTTEDPEGLPVFEAGPLGEAVIGAFGLGCAVGIEYPERILPILRQTHEEDTGAIVEECRTAQLERIEEMKAAAEPIDAETFIGAIVENVEEQPYGDSDTAQNALSMSFEYGLILAHTARGAAVVVRNEVNRAQQEQLEDFEDGLEEEAPEGPDPYHTLQEFAVEVMTAYEADMGPLV